MAHRLEAPHAPFALSGRLMGVLSPVVQPSSAPMLQSRQKLFPCSPVARELVGDHRTRYITQSFEQLAQEALACPGVASLLHQDIQGLPALIHRPPQVDQLAVEKHLAQMPVSAKPRPPCRR